MKSRHHSLIELAQLFLGQYLQQLRLSHQQDMQQLMGMSFQVAEQPQGFQNFGSQVLCLFNNNECLLALGMGLE